jgi:hypothetical protein
MGELRDDLDFLKEARRANVVRQFRLENLEGNLATMLQVLREKDDGHSATAQLTLDAIAITERLAKAAQDVCRRDRGRVEIEGTQSHEDAVETTPAFVSLEQRRHLGGYRGILASVSEEGCSLLPRPLECFREQPLNPVTVIGVHNDR